MADNTAQNGTATIGSDDVSGVLYQRVKRAHGRADAAPADTTTPYSFLAAAGANQDSTVIKASAGALYGLVVTNSNAAIRYLKIYDKATGPTSADTPKFRFAVPGNTAGAGIAYQFHGVDFAAGISFRMTTGVADNDTAAVAANEVILNAEYV